MVREEQSDKLIEYIYGETPPFERSAFAQELKQNPALEEEHRDILRMRRIFGKNFPEQKVPAKLTRKILSDLEIRPSWYEIWSQAWFKPSLVGAMMVALILGVTQQVRKGWHPLQETGWVPNSTQSAMAPEDPELKFSDLLLAKQPMREKLQVPLRRSFPGYGTGQVSLASYGPGGTLPGATRAVELPSLELQADTEVAQFIHRQALRMASMGDFRGAAKELAQLIKAYPGYPRKLEALAQRIHCLFKAGEIELATKEMAWLKQLNPELALILSERWKL